jgi:hypothetical protein
LLILRLLRSKKYFAIIEKKFSIERCMKVLPN